MIMAIINGTAGDDPNLIGTGDDDTTNAFDGNDRLIGGNGSDALLGGGDNDRLFGGADDDTFLGFAGDDRDIMTGGSGADQFRFVDADPFGDGVEYSTGVGNGRDIVTDLSGAEDDVLNIQGIDADLSTVADDAFAFVGEIGDDGLGTGEIGFVERNNLTILQGNADADPGAEFEIQLNGTGLDLGTDSFVL
jgi:Ca2+-binding RTX toxin-like protein